MARSATVINEPSVATPRVRRSRRRASDV